ncbi:hypothetical protein [Larsenimonas suaedae]|uniref:MFS transporter n=1 Tax=Larsenimonas suaedae TaxID=1851019 RepID=A0ABU1GYL6_9GAMM|nr:hypothetical protein [Larsenimonas suaedae]MCM2971405.1 hypothetical protein [Larsenimonas suaedae]MDR5896661.1 hypothetical protein [Larsenimonas suaedae]
MPSFDPPSRWLGFWAASLSLMAVFAASATPIPLYALYQSAHGLSYADLSLTAVFYFVGAITALLVFGRVSNYVCLKPVVLCALAIPSLIAGQAARVMSLAEVLSGYLGLALVAFMVALVAARNPMTEASTR